MAYPVLNTQNISGYQNLPLSNNNNKGTNNPQLANKTVALNETGQTTSRLTSNYNSNDYSYVKSKSQFKESIILKETLGWGLGGIVCKGHFKQNGTNQKVAIKTIKNTKSIRGLSLQQKTKYGDTFIKQTTDEINSLKKLQHSDNIIKILEVFEEDFIGNNFRVHIIMELADISLSAYKKQLDDRQIIVSKEEANFTAYQCLSAISDCNKLQIFHGDTHAGNFLISFSQRKIKLCDFGILSTYNSQQSPYLMSIRTINTIIKFINHSNLDSSIFEDVIWSVKTSVSQRYKISLQEADNHPDYLTAAKEETAKFLDDNQQLAETLVSSEKYCRENKDTCLADKIISEIEEKATCVPLTPLKKAKKQGGCVVS